MIRRPLQFETATAGTYTWPRYQLEYDASQALHGAVSELVGADYVYDALEDLPAVKGPGTHTIRYMLIGAPAAIEAEVDEMRSVCHLGARGWLILEADDGSQRRCAARISALPDIKLGTRDRQRMPIVLTFTQFTDFENVDPIDDHDGAVQAIAGSPAHVFVNNPGNAIHYGPKITIKGTFGPTVEITNESLAVPGTVQPWRFEANADGAAASDWLEIDVAANTVRFSDDSGATWAALLPLDVALQDGQVGLFALAPGLNDLTIEGAAGADIEFEFRGVWV